MVSDQDNRLIPLRREFSQAWHGFDRNQVLQYLDHVEATLRRVMADRDQAIAQTSGMSRELENTRHEIGKLRNRVEELKHPPENVEDLDDRMKRTVDLAQNQADEIVARAETAAEKNWAESSEVSKVLHERYMKLVETLDTHAEALKQEHEAALASTRDEVSKLTTEAAARREKLDAEAEARRRRLEDDFDAKMTAEHAALEKHIADQKTAAKNQAERRLSEATAEATRLVDEATEKATRMVDEATAKAEKLVAEATAEADRRTSEANDTIDRLTKIREEARARLREADEVLQQGESALKPADDEEETLANAVVSEDKS